MSTSALSSLPQQDINVQHATVWRIQHDDGRWLQSFVCPSLTDDKRAAVFTETENEAHVQINRIYHQSYSLWPLYPVAHVLTIQNGEIVDA